MRRGDYDDALGSLNVLLDEQRDSKIYSLLAKILIKKGLNADAAEILEVAAAEDPARSEEFCEQAMKIWFELNNHDRALSVARPLITKAQKNAELAFIIASSFLMRKEKESVRLFLPVLAESKNTKHNSLAVLLLSNMPEDTRDRQTIRTLLKKFPQSIMLIQAYMVACREVNDFVAMAKYQPVLDRLIKDMDPRLLASESPFYNLHWLADESINKLIGRDEKAVTPQLSAQRRSMPHQWGEKIRIGYLSSDFWAPHATMKLIRGVLEAHDHDRFEIILFCYTDENRLDPDEIRRKWGKIVNIREMTNEQAARSIREHNIDILVEMKGHTRQSRAAILNHRTAPIHVAWLGYPGSTVNVDLDYIIGDHFVLPDHAKPHYWEKFCRLPDSYQPNDILYRPRSTPLTRREAGLPEDKFVFASFNATRKISLRNIELWIKILKATPNSVIWMMCVSEESHINMEKKLKGAGIDAERIIFTPLVSYETHLARIELADVGLDTYPVNGHTTTSEQLWAGLPVITMKGTHFASRVSESLLNAIGLPETVAEDEDDYFRIATDLYNDQEKLSGYRKKLQENRFIKPLFDHERFCQHLEIAYEMMTDRAKKGLDPDHIDVPALPTRTDPFTRDDTVNRKDPQIGRAHV